MFLILMVLYTLLSIHILQQHSRQNPLVPTAVRHTATVCMSGWLACNLGPGDCLGQGNTEVMSKARIIRLKAFVRFDAVFHVISILKARVTTHTPMIRHFCVIGLRAGFKMASHITSTDTNACVYAAVSASAEHSNRKMLQAAAAAAAGGGAAGAAGAAGGAAAAAAAAAGAGAAGAAGARTELSLAADPVYSAVLQPLLYGVCQLMTWSDT